MYNRNVDLKTVEDFAALARDEKDHTVDFRGADDSFEFLNVYDRGFSDEAWELLPAALDSLGRLFKDVADVFAVNLSLIDRGWTIFIEPLCETPYFRGEGDTVEDVVNLVENEWLPNQIYAAAAATLGDVMAEHRIMEYDCKTVALPALELLREFDFSPEEEAAAQRLEALLDPLDGRSVNARPDSADFEVYSDARNVFVKIDGPDPFADKRKFFGLKPFETLSSATFRLLLTGNLGPQIEEAVHDLKKLFDEAHEADETS